MTRSNRFWTLAIAALAAFVLMAPARPDPERNTSFRLELDGSSLGSFHSIDGLEVSIEVVEFREGNDPNPRKLPGNVSFPNITLKRGYVNPSFFENWVQEVRDAAPGFRKNLTLVVLNRRGAEVARYNLFECWPSSWKLSSENSKGNDAMTETLEIAHTGFMKERQ
jgi:phage tail-like protein